MSAEHSKSDLRSTSREYNRGIAQKAKWARGAHPSAPGRINNPRPVRVSDTASLHRTSRVGGSAIKSAQAATNDMHAAAARTEWSASTASAKYSPTANSDGSGGSSDVEEMHLDAEVIAQPGQEVLLSDDGNEEKGPATGNTVLHSALSKALKEYEDRETVKLVKSEWSVLDDAGEEVGLSPIKGVRGARRPGLREKALSFEGEWDFV